MINSFKKTILELQFDLEVIKFHYSNYVQNGMTKRELKKVFKELNK
jgi:arsenate reductase-like glutaredoxin family protein